MNNIDAKYKKREKMKKEREKSVQFSAFSLAEVMVLLLLVSIFMAATMPIISKRAKVKPKLSSSGGGGQILYLYGSSYGNVSPGSCTTNYNSYYDTENTNVQYGGGTCKKLTQNTYSITFPVYPKECPPDWSDIANVGVTLDFNGNTDNVFNHSNYYTLIRSCYNTKKTCAVMYLYGLDTSGDLARIYGWSGAYLYNAGGTYKKLTSIDGSSSFEYYNYPPPCPPNWEDAGVGTKGGNYWFYNRDFVRSCYKCN